MNPLDITRPATLDESLAAYRGSDNAAFLSGGMTLVPSMKAHLAAPDLLVDLSGLPELRGIGRQGDRLILGAFTRFADLAASELVRGALPALADLAAQVADRHVRNRGTIGGSLANNDPAADAPAAMLALGATFVTDRRRLAAEDFFAGLFITARDEDEILVSMELPIPDAAAYAKHPHPASGYAVAGVFVARFGAQWRVAVTGSGNDGVFRLTSAEALLAEGAPLSDAALDIDPEGLFDDANFPAKFRAAAIGWLLRDAVSRL
jgi:carbon-monoxide dehydrogenase medium subunit